MDLIRKYFHLNAACSARTPGPVAATRRSVPIWLLLALILVGVMPSLPVQAQAGSIVVQPTAPRALQPTFARIMLPGCKTVAAVRHAAGQFALDVVSTLCFLPPPGLFEHEVGLGQLPQGEYRVRAFDAEAAGRPPLAAEVAFTVTAPTPGAFFDEHQPLVNYSGNWWNPARAGEGWFVEHAVPDRLILVWATYASNGLSTWLVMQANTRSYGRLSGPVYRSSGTPPNVTVTPVGVGSFNVTQPGSAQFIFTATGQAPEAIALQRLPLQ